MKRYLDTLTNDDFRKLNKSTLKDLKALQNLLREEGWIIDPSLGFKGISGKVCKSDYIWFIKNLVKIDLVD